MFPQHQGNLPMPPTQPPQHGNRSLAVVDKVRQLKQRIAQNQKCSPKEWEAVVDDLKGVVATDDTRRAYEEILDVMPSAGSVWVRYIQSEFAAGNLEAAKNLFGRCLLQCPSVELHALYLQFIKRSNEGRGAQGLIELKQAYEFTLDCVGQDMTAGGLWSEFINFLQQPRVGTEGFVLLFPDAYDGQEEAARIHVIRRVYQRAVQVPGQKLDELWRNYEAWEVKTDRVLGRKVLEEWRPKYKNARETIRDRKRLVDQLHMEALPFPPGKGGPQQTEQVRQWKQFLEYELSNPQRLEPDSPVLSSRVALVFGQCLAVLWYFPEIWHQCALYQLAFSNLDTCLVVLQRGQAALPNCTLLRFAQAELLEFHQNIEGARQVYEDMVTLLEREIPSQPDQPAHDANGNATYPDAQLSPFGGEQGILIWLQYIRFLRRVEGPAIARHVFLRARRWQQHSIALAPLTPEPQPDPHRPPRVTGGQLYAGMARLEWTMDRGTKDVACRIFELGLEDPRLAKEAAYINTYNSFLCEIGDVDNARALFERVLGDREVCAAAAIWRAYAVLEASQGNVAAALKVEDRMRAALASVMENGAGAAPQGFLNPTIATLQVAVCKYGQEGILPCDADTSMHLKIASALMPPPPIIFEEEPQPQQHVSSKPGPKGKQQQVHVDTTPEPQQQAQDDEPVDLVALFCMQLPPYGGQAVEGPMVPVEAVLDVVMFADTSEPVQRAVIAELEVGNLPDGNLYGVAIPHIIGMAAVNRPPQPQELQYQDQGPPMHRQDPYMHDGYQEPYQDQGYEHDQYMYDAPMSAPGPMGPMSRKRRWETERDGPPRGPRPMERMEREYDREFDQEFEGPRGHDRPPRRERDRDRRPRNRERMDR